MTGGKYPISSVTHRPQVCSYEIKLHVIVVIRERMGMRSECHKIGFDYRAQAWVMEEFVGQNVEKEFLSWSFSFSHPIPKSC
jgi:hypothetical protein